MISGEQQNLKEQIVNEYGPDLDKLTEYLTWLESKAKAQQKYYESGETEGENSNLIPVPVYDSMLLNFVKAAKNTKFMDKNYMYTYRKYKLENPSDERNAMQRAKITDIALFRGILSKYVKEGQIKSTVWTTGLNEGIYVEFLMQLNRIFYDHSNGASKYVNIRHTDVQ